ncbi:stage II sporulation protein D [Strepomyces sp. STD 3.1]|nr:stage II sporulation protein D [Streptomyces sp. STD 3.1]
MKKLYLFLGLVFLIVLIPSVVVVSFGAGYVPHDKENSLIKKDGISLENQPSQKSSLNIKVSIYRTSNREFEDVPLEEYVAGVVASEMPTNFELEALKAQALSARTYIIKSLISPNKETIAGKADITDSTSDQVYKSREELKKAWGKNYGQRMKKVNQAVNETRGQILTYGGEPINAFFFSTSNGYTENSEDYWSTPIPYLRSVPSHWDETSPKFKESKTFSINAFEQKLNVQVPSKGEIASIRRNHSQRVEVVNIGGKNIKGKHVRETLGLNSSDFIFNRMKNEIIVTTKGYGHGVGMSQYGANGMAKEGKNYKNIISYYYKNVEVDNMETFPQVRQLALGTKN